MFLSNIKTLIKAKISFVFSLCIIDEFLNCSSTFESVDEILLCDHSNETSSTVLSHDTIFSV